MNYNFPVISNFKDLEPYIDQNVISVNYKDDYIVVNYNVADKVTFPDLKEGDVARFRRECRGIIFDKDTGNIIRRPFHKFFNLGEREEILLDKIDLSQPHLILEKIDGSMVTPLVSNGKLRFATKAGITDTSALAEEFVRKNPKFVNFCKSVMMHKATPIFEFVSRDNRIVIDYPEPQMILTAIRSNHTGFYARYEDMSHFACQHDIPLVKIVRYSDTSLSEEIIDRIYKASDVEGVVIRFNDGHMLKVKTEWYVNIHRAKDACLHEKRVLAMILEDKIDDVLAFLQTDDAQKLMDYRDAFWEGFRNTTNEIKARLDEIHSQGVDRKTYALHYSPLHSSAVNAVTFKCWNDSSKVEEFLKTLILKNLGSQTDVDNVRHLWGIDVRWKF